MKTMLLLAAVLLTCTTFAQTVLTVKVDKYLPVDTTITKPLHDSIIPVTQKPHMVLDTARRNALQKKIADFNKKKNWSNFNAINAFIANEKLDTVAAVKTWTTALNPILEKQPDLSKITLPALNAADADVAMQDTTITVVDTTVKHADTTVKKTAVPPDNPNCRLAAFDNIKFIKQDDDYIVILKDSNGNALASFPIVQLNKALFYDRFKVAVQTLCTDPAQAAQIDSIIAKFHDKTPTDLYTDFLESKNNLDNTIGLAGVLTIYKRTVVHVDSTILQMDTTSAPAQRTIKKDLDSTHTSGTPVDSVPKPKVPKSKLVANDYHKPFTIQEMQIQFQDGFIENIKVFGKLNGTGHLFRFENFYPIGFSTKRDFRNLIDEKLHEKSDYEKYRNYSLTMGEILSYNQNLANDNKDYSPANQVFTTKALSEDTKEVPLFKDQTSKILEAEVFSDLKGADNDNPNGLIQVELSKRLNFFSKKYKFLWNDNIGNIGYLNYVTPQFALNKVEDNQKHLIVNHIDTLSFAADTSKPVTYTSTINLLKHQIYNVGFDVSIFTIDIPGLKSTFNIGAGLYFGRTSLQDTLRTKTRIDSTHFIFKAADANNVLQYGVNTFQWGPYITWQIFPDSRFGVSATQRFTWFKALNSNFIQVRDSAHYLNFIAKTDKRVLNQTPYNYSDLSNSLFASLFTKCIASSEIYAYFSPNSDGSNKLFFRYRLNWDLKNAKENYQQMQVGFSTYISSTKAYTNLKKAAGIDN